MLFLSSSAPPSAALVAATGRHPRASPSAPQRRPHLLRYIAEFDIDRTGVVALVAYRAVIGHVFEFGPMLRACAAPGLLFIQESLDQKRSGKDLVARRLQTIGARHMRGANRLALAAPPAVLDGI